MNRRILLRLLLAPFRRSRPAGPPQRGQALESATWGGFAASAVVGGLWLSR